MATRTVGLLLVSIACGAAAANAQERVGRDPGADELPAALLAEETLTETATVTAIDPDTRLVSLQTAGGEELAVEAGEDVRNFDQIEVGDTVNVVYFAAVAAEVTEAPPSDSDEAVVVKTVRAPEGQRPGGGAGVVYTVAVTVDAVEDDSILFTGPSGAQREVMADRPEVQEFIAKLAPGDRVQVTFGEAMAVAISPAQDPPEGSAEDTTER